MDYDSGHHSDTGCTERPVERVFMIARNPKPDSRLPYILYLPVSGEGPLVLATSDTWPQGRDLFCLQLEADSWPGTRDAEILDTVAVQSCWRAGKAVHLVLKRRQRRRSMFIWTESRGRTLVFWRTQQTMRAARPGIRVPAARGLERRTLSIAVDHRERYPWRFPRQHATTERRELPVGDYGVFFGNRLVAAVERKSVADLMNAVSSGTMRMQLAELSRLPRSILVVEGRLSDIEKAGKEARVSEGWLLNVIAALLAEYPTVQWLFAETRNIGRDMAYRWLSAAVVLLREECQAGDKAGRSDPASRACENGDGLTMTSSSELSSSELSSPARCTDSVATICDVDGSRVLDPVDSGMLTHDARGTCINDCLGRRREALLLAREGRTWTVRDYRDHFQISTATACNDLKALERDGTLACTGRRRPKQYVCVRQERD